MTAQPEINGVTLTFDPHRGGFFLDFGHATPTERSLILFGGLIRVNLTADFRLARVGCDWGYGGLLIKALFLEPDKPRHEVFALSGFPIIGDETQSGPILVRQNPKYFELWFGSPPLEQPPTHLDPNTRVSVWLAPERVNHAYWVPACLGGGNDKPVMIGIRLQFNCLPVTYPVRFLSLRLEDIK